MSKLALPLERIKVLDLTFSYAGPFCTMLLGDMGADVVKIEDNKGDDSRYWGPPFSPDGNSPWFLSVNRNKKSILLNLKNDIEVFQKLLAKADVFVTSLSLGALEKLNITYKELCQINEKIIYCAITGFGLTGPYRYKPCYDLISEGIGGIMSVTGDNGQPQKIGTAAGDILAGYNATIAIIAALYRRDKTGKGELIDVNLVDSVISFTTPRIVSYLITVELPIPDGNKSTPIAIYQPLKTKDGYLNLAIGNDKIWEKLCKLLKLENLLTKEEYKTNAGRKIHRKEIVDILESILINNTTDIWFSYLSEAGIPCGPIYYIDQLSKDPHINERKTIFYIDNIPQVAPPFRLCNTKEKIHSAPPGIGENTKEILERWLNS